MKITRQTVEDNKWCCPIASTLAQEERITIIFDDEPIDKREKREKRLALVEAVEFEYKFCDYCGERWEIDDGRIVIFVPTNPDVIEIIRKEDEANKGKFDEKLFCPQCGESLYKCPQCGEGLVS